MPLTLKNAWIENIMKFCCHSLWPWFVTSSFILRALFVKGDFVELSFYEVIFKHTLLTHLGALRLSFIGGSGLLSEIGLRSGDKGHTLGRWYVGWGGVGGELYLSSWPCLPRTSVSWVREVVQGRSKLLCSGEICSWWPGRVFLPVVQLAFAAACKVLGPQPGAPAPGRGWQLWTDILSPPT